MDLFAPRHLLVILLIVVLVFGTKKLSTIGADLGAAVRGFKKSMRDADFSADSEAPSPQLTGDHARNESNTAAAKEKAS